MPGRRTLYSWARPRYHLSLPVSRFILRFGGLITELWSIHQVAASVLDTLLAASGSPDSGFQVAAVVTQPPAAKNRGRKLMPSAVAQLALDRGFLEELIFTPERAREVPFLVTILESGRVSYGLWRVLVHCDF